MEIHRDANNNLHRDNDQPAIVTPRLMQYYSNNKLHRANGPAVITASGGKQYYWRGVHIEPSLWNRQKEMTAQEILTITNIEVRRSMIEMVGFNNFIKQSKYSVLDEDKDTGAILYKVDMPEDDKAEPLVVVKVQDGTPHDDGKGNMVRKEYFIRVPPAMTKCKAAIAWTFDTPENKYYAIEKET